MRFSSYFVGQALGHSYELFFFELARHNKSLIQSIPFRPVQGTIYLTENCNSKCITCSLWKQKSQGELTVSEIASIMPQLRRLGVSYLCLSGGEALLRRDLTQVVSIAREHGFRRIQLITNALLLTKDKAEDLLNCGLNKVTISLNGIGETHDVTRGVAGSFERCLEALGHLTELRNQDHNHVDVGINMVVMRPNLDQVLNVANLCKQLDIALSLTPIDNRAFYETRDVSSLMIEDQRKLDEVVSELHGLLRKYPTVINETHTSLEYLRNYFTDRVRRDIPCYLGYLSVFVGAHGDVFSGCEVLPPLGNIRERSLVEIVNSKEYRQNLASMFTKKCPGCACDYGLNLYAHVPAILEEVLWRLPVKSPRTVIPKKKA